MLGANMIRMAISVVFSGSYSASPLVEACPSLSILSFPPILFCRPRSLFVLKVHDVTKLPPSLRHNPGVAQRGGEASGSSVAIFHSCVNSDFVFSIFHISYLGCDY
ncbi:uncharacterized protein LACBIDRAFT_316586 [Laccaria bicolor S238N-H82]|uniref:Predicted protein n=1 Tax=Laccaria bicolor (strain S238N-H82 / ATCC MYA-4686) TaxID=486041 RepID=B0E176_LACBS|nr:uncharacterized protein LACBIDRAFT_316586 [Laccaria bicolor S238N-H82]EDQ99409.1 predicted protein [Laccaria bicolor S238N-H82]|eukprot:XP_001889960.1 predicted protein [Laccaria bicolor S238N-H82]